MFPPQWDAGRGRREKGSVTMNEVITELEPTQNETLATEISDDALEAAAEMSMGNYTLGACTGLSVCPA